MDKDLHDIDDIFNKAHQRYTEEPSGAAWEKISAVLEKDDAEKYKKRFIGWKRIAIVLILLLSGLMIYEAGIITNGKEGGLGKQIFQPSGRRIQPDCRSTTSGLEMRLPTEPCTGSP